MTTDHDKLAQLAMLTAAMHHGRAAFEQRLGELSAGFPSTGDGGSGSGSGNEGGPTANAVVRAIDPCDRCVKEGKRCTHGTDPARKVRDDYERHLAKALSAAVEAWEQYKRIATPRPGVSKLKDPGCELCNRVPCGGTLCPRKNETSPYRCETVPAHWCPVYASAEVSEAGPRGTTVTRVVALCTSCYEFNRPDRAGRLPSHDEVLDHVEGRKRRWKVGA